MLLLIITCRVSMRLRCRLRHVTHSTRLLNTGQGRYFGISSTFSDALLSFISGELPRAHGALDFD